MIYTDINAIPRQNYGLIMADPAWTFKTYSEKGHGKSAQAQYDCMTLGDIQSLPIADMAAPDCLLWLWATNPMLPQAIETLNAWGFTYKTAGHWSKKTKHGKQAFGTGYILRCAGEPFIIGTMGKPKTSRAVRSVIEGQVRRHSQKPGEAFAEAEKLIPNAQRIELFSRADRAGWDVFGNEVNG